MSFNQSAISTGGATNLKPLPPVVKAKTKDGTPKGMICVGAYELQSFKAQFKQESKSK